MTANRTSANERRDAHKWCAAQKWFHAIDFGDGLVSRGRFDAKVPPNYTLFGFFDLIPHFSLEEATCVDVGTMDGIAAFIMKKLGAREVIATDLAPRKTFTFSRERLGLDIDYRTPAAALDLPQLLGRDSADLVAMAGVLYHVFDPLTVLSACREILRRDGYLLVETTYLFDERRPIMSFNPVDTSSRGIERANVFWRASKSAVEGMLRVVGFEVLGSVAVNGRITFLAQAKRPSDMLDVPDRVRTIHETYMKYANYGERVDYDRLEVPEAPTARIRYTGPRGDRFLHRSTYRPRVPFHPTWTPPTGIGSVRERLRDWRFRLSSRG